MRRAFQVISGVGGVGKTQIAIEYAHRFVEQYDRAWWINCEDETLIDDQISAFAVQLGLVDVGSSTAVAVQSVARYLRGHDRWLLVFDNVTNLESIWRRLPEGPGHVLITARSGGWNRNASGAIEINIMKRPDSIQLLRTYVASLDDDRVNQLAEALGDLPLALTQAGSFLADTGTPVSEYLEILSRDTRSILGEGAVGTYPRPLVATIRQSMRRLRDLDSSAVTIAQICSLLAPDPILVKWVTEPVPVDHVSPDGPLRGLFIISQEDPITLRRAVGRLNNLGLAKSDSGTLRMHRLTQAIIREDMPAADRAKLLSDVQILLAMKYPGDPDDARNWPGWARLLPHLIATHAEESGNRNLRSLMVESSWWLLIRGDVRAGLELSQDLYQKWSENLGPSDLLTLRAATIYARALRDLGEYVESVAVGRDSLQRYRHATGNNDSATLESAHNLAISIRHVGLVDEAIQLQRDTLNRRSRVLGEDHPDTLYTQHDLAVTLRESGRLEESIVMLQEVQRRQARVVGSDHAATMRSEHNLAIALYRLGRFDDARQILENVLTRRRDTLGESHPDVLYSRFYLASTFRAMGRLDEARELYEAALIQRKQILGGDHPVTLDTAHGLAGTLADLGQLDRAREIGHDTLFRRRRVYGSDHPATEDSVELLRLMSADPSQPDEA